MKNVTVAIDFDEELENIVQFTARLFKEKNTSLHVVHVYQSQAALLDFDPTLIDQLDDYEKLLQKEADAVREAVKKLKGCRLQAYGYMKPIQKDVADSLLDFAQSKHSDLIIMGTNHPGMVERIVVGSVAETVIRHTSIPVIVIPKTSEK